MPGSIWNPHFWATTDPAATPPVIADPTQYDTGEAILAALLRQGGDLHPTVAAGNAAVGNASRLIDAKLQINQAYWEICGLRPWRWCRARLQFASVGQEDVTVVSVVGQTVELVTPLTPSRAGSKIYVGGDLIPHRISAHASGSRFLTLEAAYTGDSTAGPGTIFQDEVPINLTDVLGWPEVNCLDTWVEIEIVPETHLRKMAPRNTIGIDLVGKRYVAFLNDHTLRMVPWTPSPRLFELSYNYRPPPFTFDGTPQDVPILPRDSRVVILLRALERFYPDKKDPRGQQSGAFTSDAYNRMVSVDLSFSKPRVYVPPGRSLGGS